MLYPDVQISELIKTALTGNLVETIVDLIVKEEIEVLHLMGNQFIAQIIGEEITNKLAADYPNINCNILYNE